MLETSPTSSMDLRSVRCRGAHRHRKEYQNGRGRRKDRMKYIFFPEGRCGNILLAWENNHFRRKRKEKGMQAVRNYSSSFFISSRVIFTRLIFLLSADSMVKRKSL